MGIENSPDPSRMHRPQGSTPGGPSSEDSGHHSLSSFSLFENPARAIDLSTGQIAALSFPAGSRQKSTLIQDGNIAIASFSPLNARHRPADNDLHLYFADANGGVKSIAIPLGMAYAQAVSLHPNGTHVAVAVSEGLRTSELRIYALDRRDPDNFRIESSSSLPVRVTQLEYSPCGQRLALGTSSDGELGSCYRRLFILGASDALSAPGFKELGRLGTEGVITHMQWSKDERNLGVVTTSLDPLKSAHISRVHLVELKEDSSSSGSLRLKNFFPYSETCPWAEGSDESASRRGVYAPLDRRLFPQGSALALKVIGTYTTGDHIRAAAFDFERSLAFLGFGPIDSADGKFCGVRLVQRETSSGTHDSGLLETHSARSLLVARGELTTPQGVLGVLSDQVTHRFAALVATDIIPCTLSYSLARSELVPETPVHAVNFGPQHSPLAIDMMLVGGSIIALGYKHSSGRGIVIKSGALN